jgi:hypothetical protein
MSQLDYTIDQAVGFEGQLADLSLRDTEVGVAETEILVGKLLTMGSSLSQVKHPDSAAKITDKKLVRGIASHHHAMESKYPAGSGNYSYPQNASVNVLRKGRVWVKPEQVVTAGVSKVFARFANGILDNLLVQKGALRKDRDGTAQVNTLTPTVTNADNYSVTVYDELGKVVASGDYLSDGTATAAEIVAGLKAALGTPVDVVLTGANTLIITAAEAGKPFTLGLSANLASVATTANAQTAAEVPEAKWKSSTTAVGQLAILEIDL